MPDFDFEPFAMNASTGANNGMQVSDLVISLGTGIPINVDDPKNECRICTSNNQSDFFLQDGPFFNGDFSGGEKASYLAGQTRLRQFLLRKALNASEHPQMIVKAGILGEKLMDITSPGGQSSATIIRERIAALCGAEVRAPVHLREHRCAPAHLRASGGGGAEPKVVPIPAEFRSKLMKIFGAYWDAVMTIARFPPGESYRTDNFFRCHVVYNAHFDDCFLIFHGAGQQPNVQHELKAFQKFCNFFRIKSGFYSVKQDKLCVFSVLERKNEFGPLLAKRPVESYYPYTFGEFVCNIDYLP
eukprot:18626_1